MFLKQPNGLFARFSGVVDDFTHMNMTEAQLLDVALDYMGRHDAKQALQRAIEDHKPMSVIPGSGLDRWNDCIETVLRCYDKERQADRIAHGTMENPTEMYHP